MIKIRFKLTENHIKLLRRFYVYFDDGAYCGAPKIDIKRPYGNSSVWHDIFEIINGDKWDSYEAMPDDLVDSMMAIHRETATALQIVLGTMSFVPGVYEKEQYGERWELTKKAELNNFTSGLSDDKKSYYVKRECGQVVGDFYLGADYLTAEQARMGAQAAANALNALENKG
jgi:hypothetical protein